MDKRYVLPASTMIGGLGLWVVLVVLRLVRFGPVHGLVWLAPVMCIASGALVLVSGVLCARAKGPFAGQVVRFVVLLGLAAYAHWTVAPAAAVAALVAAAGILVVGVVVLASRGDGRTG